MTDWYTETDSGVGEITPREPDKKHFRVVPGTLGTLGGSYSTNYVAETDINNVFAQVFKTLDKTEDTRVQRDAIGILHKIQDILARYEFGDLPKLHAVNNEDGSVQIEWPFDDFRIGFTIEKVPEETGWYMVSKENLGRKMSAGDLSAVNAESTLNSLLDFIRQNS